MTTPCSRRGFLAATGGAVAAAAAGSAVERASASDRADAGSLRARAQDDLEDVIDEAMAGVLDADGATGGTVALVRDGEVALTKGYGHAILDEDEPISDESLFQLGSTVKTVTWTAAMQAADRGLVDLDTAVDEYLETPEIDNPYDEPVTLPRLATHTAGFEARIVGDTVRDLDHRRPLPETLREHQPPVVRPPGELPGYTNYAAGLAGQVVADAADTTYEDYVAEELFAPLGMTDSTFDPAPDGLGAGPESCYFDEFGWYSDIAPASGMSSTARDMAQFVLAHLSGGTGAEGRILSPEATDEMHRQWHTPHEAVTGMAFGFTERTRGDTRVLSHTGAVPGFSTDMVLVPDEDFGLFVSIQGESPGGARSDVVDALLDEVAPVEENRLEPDGRPERTDDLTGTYRNVHGTDGETYNRFPMAAYMGEIDVSVADDGALVTDSGGSTERWVEVEPLVFRSEDDTTTLAFLEGADGEGDGVTHLVRDGSAVAYERIGAHEQFGAQLKLLAVTTVLALSGVVGWAVAGAWRRFGRGDPIPDDARRARWVAGAAVGAVLALPLALIGVGAWAAMAGAPALQSRPPSWLWAVFLLPVLSGIATVAGGVFAARAWYERRWSVPTRLHYTAVVASTAVLVWLCHYWRLAV